MSKLKDGYGLFIFFTTIIGLALVFIFLEWMNKHPWAWLLLGVALVGIVAFRFWRKRRPPL